MGWLKNLMGSFSTKVQNSQNAAAAPKNDEPAPSDVVGTYEYGMRLLEKENVEKALIFLRRAAVSDQKQIPDESSLPAHLLDDAPHEEPDRDIGQGVDREECEKHGSRPVNLTPHKESQVEQQVADDVGGDHVADLRAAAPHPVCLVQPHCPVQKNQYGNSEIQRTHICAKRHGFNGASRKKAAPELQIPGQEVRQDSDRGVNKRQKPAEILLIILRQLQILYDCPGFRTVMILLKAFSSPTNSNHNIFRFIWQEYAGFLIVF